MLRCSGSACRTAVSPGCECKCGGGNHGAYARILWAAAMMVPPENRTDEQTNHAKTAEEQRKNATEKLEQQQKSHASLSSIEKPRRADATAFFEFSRSVEIVNWLIENRECQEIESMALKVGDACEKLLTQHPKWYKRLADHFWCDILAALVQVLTEILDAADKFPEHVSELGARTWDAVHSQRSESNGNAPSQRKKRKDTTRADEDAAENLDYVILKKAVEDLVETLMTGVTEATHAALDLLVLRLQVLAILFCPDPYAHKALWNYCVVPLLKQRVVIQSEKYSEKFLEMFKQQWPGLSISLC